MILKREITKDLYLDIMEAAISAYSEEELLSQLPPPGGLLPDIHWYARAACVLGFLISKGRLTRHKDLWLRMMDALAADFPQRNRDISADFAVKEFCLCLNETSFLVPSHQLQRWLQKLALLNPYEVYHFTLENVEENQIRHNINVYNMTGEYLRSRLGVSSCEAYFQQHMPFQLDNFSKDGMYMDPGCPLLYDLTTRVHFQSMLQYGYRGAFFPQIDAFLKKGGQCALMLQTATGELPFGGRSNQFAFNDVLLAANFEYEAVRYHREGDHATAGQFKRAAHLAAQSVQKWISQNQKQHVKNYYPRETKHGCEDYAYYAKYLITAGCFAVFAYTCADDAIAEVPCPAELGSHFFQTDPVFHKLFLAKDGQTAVIDFAPDGNYDAAGLGAYHVKGIPSPFTLASPFSQDHGKYVNIIGYPKTPVSFSPGFLTKTGKQIFLPQLSIKNHTVKIIECNKRSTCAEVLWEMDSPECTEILERFTLTEAGLCITATLPQGKQACYQLPYFISDGQTTATLEVTATAAINRMKAIFVSFQTDGVFTTYPDIHIGNRNGEYGVLTASSAENHITVSVNAKLGEK